MKRKTAGERNFGGNLIRIFTTTFSVVLHIHNIYTKWHSSMSISMNINPWIDDKLEVARVCTYC